MPHFTVKAKDKLTQHELTFTITAKDAEAAKKYVEDMPRSMGGSHPGLEPISADEIKPEEAH